MLTADAMVDVAEAMMTEVTTRALLRVVVCIRLRSGPPTRMAGQRAG
jgi:hypothetical protein